MIPFEFWKNQESLVLLNPRMNLQEKETIQNAILQNSQENVVWLKSSGTESSGKGTKLVCLSKEAILNAAESVNSFYQVNSTDCWLNPLPEFHVGGLSIKARCYLAGAREVEFDKWDPASFIKEVGNHGATISSLVPTQVYDLVQAELQSPKSLRFVLLGGGPIDFKIYKKARELGWPLIPSYGMTETSALIAGANLASLKSNEFPLIEVLPHVEFLKFNEKYQIQSKSLFTGYLWINDGETLWQERPEPFVLDDRLDIQGKHLKVLGRESEIIKILGETVNLQELTEKLKIKIKEEIVILPVEHPRSGFELHLVIECGHSKYEIEDINKNLMPFEKFNSLLYLEKFPRTELGKINKAKIRLSFC